MKSEGPLKPVFVAPAFSRIFYDRTAFRYLVAGLACTGLGYAAMFFALFVLRLNDFFCNAFAFAVGLSFSYVVNSRFVFEHKGPRWPAVARFLISFAICYLLNLAALFGLKAVGVSSTIAQVTAFTLYSGSFYLLNRFWNFRAAAASNE